MSTQDRAAVAPYGLLKAVEAITNWKALAMTAVAGLAVFVCMALAGYMGQIHFTLGLLFGLVTLFVAMVGYSAVGIMLMRRAQVQDVGFGDAVLQAVFTVPRMLGVGFLLFLAFVGLCIGAFLILLLCKIPGLGGALFAIALPVLAVVMGMAFAGMAYVAVPLAAPAIWAGNSVWETTARIVVIVRQRLLQVIVNLAVLTFLVFFVGAVVFVVLYSGYGTVMAMAAAVGINAFGGMVSLLASALPLLGQSAPYADGASYGSAAAFGAGLLFTIGMVLPFLTFINGACLIYIQTSEGLDFSQAEERMRSQVEEAKRRAQEAKAQAGSHLQEAKVSMQEASRARQHTCGACHSPMNAGDAFCGECGAKGAAV